MTSLSPEIIRDLKDAASKAVAEAYCPYSEFPVGAAVLAEDGVVFSGCNIENASYGLTICAERVALFNAVRSGARRIKAVAVFTPTDQPHTPCGACRQALREFGAEADVFCYCNADRFIRCNMAELLPRPFGDPARSPGL